MPQSHIQLRLALALFEAIPLVGDENRPPITLPSIEVIGDGLEGLLEWLPGAFLSFSEYIVPLRMIWGRSVAWEVVEGAGERREKLRADWGGDLCHILIYKLD